MAVVVVVVDVVVDMAVAVEAVVVTEAVEDLATKHSTIHHRKYIAFTMHSRPEKRNCSFQCSQSNKKEIQRRFLHENRKQLTITRNFEENHRQLMVLTTLPIC